MKFFISVDMEGISGIVDSSMVSRKHQDYEKGRKLMVADVNAAIEGILARDKNAEITVCDAHGSMNNINPEDLHKVATLVRGTPKPQSQIAGLNDTFDACLFIGYHSKKGTLEGILSHTYSGGNIEKLVINGSEVGETELNAGIAGYYGVPLIFLSGDQATAIEASKLNPGIVTVAVKKAIGRTAAECLHPEKARELITKGVTQAIRGMSTIPPFKVETPVTFTITFTDSKRADAASFIPTTERLTGKTVKLIAGDYITAYHGFIAAVLCGTAISS
jgi:D-amino peptidase